MPTDPINVHEADIQLSLLDRAHAGEGHSVQGRQSLRQARAVGEAQAQARLYPRRGYVDEVWMDTHAFLWALPEPDKLSPTARQLLQEDATVARVSADSAWEISTKFRLGRLPGVKRVLADSVGALQSLQATQLPMTSEHPLKAGLRSVPYRDPSAACRPRNPLWESCRWSAPIRRWRSLAWR